MHKVAGLILWYCLTLHNVYSQKFAHPCTFNAHNQAPDSTCYCTFMHVYPSPCTLIAHNRAPDIARLCTILRDWVRLFARFSRMD